MPDTMPLPQKADMAALETKMRQEEQQYAMVQLSEMMQDLQQRMFLLEQDRKKDLKEFRKEMDSKVAVSPREGCEDGGMRQAREHVTVWGG